MCSQYRKQRELGYPTVYPAFAQLKTILMDVQHLHFVGRPNAGDVQDFQAIAGAITKTRSEAIWTSTINRSEFIQINPLTMSWLQTVTNSFLLDNDVFAYHPSSTKVGESNLFVGISFKMELRLLAERPAWTGLSYSTKQQ